MFDIFTFLFLLLTCLIMITLADILLIGFPIIKITTKLEKETFLITKPNHFEKQGKVECSAFASAYVYRHLGKNVTGMELYNEMPCKAPNGYVFCRGIVQLARKYGFHVRFHIGNLTALKNVVAKGIPVIAMIRSKAAARTLHYIAVVGYDKENIYVVDSGEKSRNTQNQHYNRIISINEFKKLWNTSMLKHPLYFNLFIDFS